MTGSHSSKPPATGGIEGTKDTRRITPSGDPVLHYADPVRLFYHLWQYRDIIRPMTRRDIAGRYRGSWLGFGWSFLQPLLMLAVYTFVFSVVFEIRWGVSAEESRAAFAIALFMGLISFSIFAETVNAAPSAVLSQPNLVKRVVFPLEVLPLVRLLGAFVQAFFSLVILILGMIAVFGAVPWTIVLLPLVWIPLGLFTLGLSYFLASVGVFIRDVAALTGILTTMLLFLSPIFYPLRAVPERFHFIYRLNPVAVFVEEARKVAVWGALPDWAWLGFAGLFSLAVLIFGFLWFMKSKNAFADVL